MNETPFNKRTTIFFSVTTLLQICAFALLISALHVLGMWLGALAVFCVGILCVNYGTAVGTLFAAVAFPQRVVSPPAGAVGDQGLKTAVVIPCLLSSTKTIDELIEGLDRNCQASRDMHAIYVLLADYVDAPETTPEVLAEDTRLLRYAADRIAALNAPQGSHFALLLRPRVWAPTEAVWMGSERKRGKIDAFNRYLIDGKTADFSVVYGDQAALNRVEYVLTLDADTILPPGSLSRLVVLLDDPRHACFAMIQPGYKPILEEPKNWYQWVHASPFPPLSILQGVFGRCKFVGKGIYRVREFQSALEGRIPSAWVLSHDVLESCLLKVGATDDVFVREANPETFEEGCARLHRWFRGDWQNLPWALPVWLRYRIPEFRTLTRVRLGLPETWTIADLVLRDLHAPSLLLLVLLSCMSQSASAALVLLMSCELCWAAVTFACKWMRNETRKSLPDFIRVPLGSAFFFASLPTQAWLAVDAGCRSLWRMFVVKRNRLQWTASAEFRHGVSARARFWTIVPGATFGTLMAVVHMFIPSYVTALLAVTWLGFPLLTLFLERQVILVAREGREAALGS